MQRSPLSRFRHPFTRSTCTHIIFPHTERAGAPAAHRRPCIKLMQLTLWPRECVIARGSVAEKQQFARPASDKRHYTLQNSPSCARSLAERERPSEELMHFILFFGGDTKIKVTSAPEGDVTSRERADANERRQLIHKTPPRPASAATILRSNATR